MMSELAKSAVKVRNQTENGNPPEGLSQDVQESLALRRSDKEKVPSQAPKTIDKIKWSLEAVDFHPLIGSDVENPAGVSKKLIERDVEDVGVHPCTEKPEVSQKLVTDGETVEGAGLQVREDLCEMSIKGWERTGDPSSSTNPDQPVEVSSTSSGPPVEVFSTTSEQYVEISSTTSEQFVEISSTKFDPPVEISSTNSDPSVERAAKTDKRAEPTGKADTESSKQPEPGIRKGADNAKLPEYELRPGHQPTLADMWDKSTPNFDPDLVFQGNPSEVVESGKLKAAEGGSHLPMYSFLCYSNEARGKGIVATYRAYVDSRAVAKQGGYCCPLQNLKLLSNHGYEFSQELWWLNRKYLPAHSEHEFRVVITTSKDGVTLMGIGESSSDVLANEVAAENLCCKIRSQLKIPLPNSGIADDVRVRSDMPKLLTDMCPGTQGKRKVPNHEKWFEQDAPTCERHRCTYLGNRSFTASGYCGHVARWKAASKYISTVCKKTVHLLDVLTGTECLDDGGNDKFRILFKRTLDLTDVPLPKPQEIPKAFSEKFGELPQKQSLKKKGKKKKKQRKSKDGKVLEAGSASGDSDGSESGKNEVIPDEIDESATDKQQTSHDAESSEKTLENSGIPKEEGNMSVIKNEPEETQTSVTAESLPDANFSTRVAEYLQNNWKDWKKWGVFGGVMLAGVGVLLISWILNGGDE